MQGMIKKRRFSFPHPVGAAAQLEPIIQPLYSMAVIDNAALSTQRETFFFRYALGQNVAGLPAAAGTVPSTVMHTNMETPGALATPKVFLATGTRLVISNLDSALTDALETGTDSTTETPVPSMMNDILEIMYGTYFRFFVGTKEYLVVPTWALPGNTGVGGLVATAVSGPDVGSLGPEQSFVSSFNTAGKGCSFGEHRILIPPQQNFHTALVAPQTTPPTPATELAIYSVLDGVFGREVQ